MKKIGILTCLNSNDVCTRAGCLSAFRERRDFFSGYPEDTILAAVMTCNGCKDTNAKEPAEDEGILEKADRLVSEKISVKYPKVLLRFHGLMLQRNPIHHPQVP